jgi:hypothetical protein
MHARCSPASQAHVGQRQRQLCLESMPVLQYRSTQRLWRSLGSRQAHLPVVPKRGVHLAVVSREWGIGGDLKMVYKEIGG